MRSMLAALLTLAALSYDPTYEKGEGPNYCGAGAVWSDEYGCQDAAYLGCTADDGPDEGCPPRTCAECTTDSECEALCGVDPCAHEGELGCWMPDDFDHPTTRTWWR